MEEFVEMERVREFFVGSSEETVDGPSTRTESEFVQPSGENIAVVTSNKQSAAVTSGHESPTSSIENERPITPDASYNDALSKPVDLPARKNVLATVGAFESVAAEPKQPEKPRVVFTQSRSQLKPEKKVASMSVDEERKRRILGLSATSNAPEPTSATGADSKSLNSDMTAADICKVAVASSQ